MTLTKLWWATRVAVACGALVIGGAWAAGQVFGPTPDHGAGTDDRAGMAEANTSREDKAVPKTPVLEDDRESTGLEPPTPPETPPIQGAAAGQPNDPPPVGAAGPAVGVAPAGPGPGGIEIPTVRGTILGPDGKAPAAATVSAVFSDRTISGIHTFDGQFVVQVGKIIVDGRGPGMIGPDRLIGVAVSAEGLGFGWANADAIAGPGVKLVKDLAIKGRILDADGQPVAGAKVRVKEVRAYLTDELKEILQTLQAKGRDRVAPSIWTVLPEWAGPVPGQSVGEATATDSDGRFRLTGLGRGRIVRLQIEAKGKKPVDLNVLTFAAHADDPALPQKDEGGRPFYMAEFEHRLAADGRQ
jgi:hypothetical protein